MDWYPDRDEDLLLRTAATFATGMASPVSGLLWFRDPERNDIQGELPDWPPVPAQAPRPTGDRAARGIGMLEKADVLAEFAREAIAGARRMPYCVTGADVRLTFTDESWVRLSTGHQNNAERFCALLSLSAENINS